MSIKSLKFSSIFLFFISIFLQISRIESLEGFSNATHPYYRPFPFTIVPSDFCPQSLKTLFVVHTTIINTGRRALIRETYADSKWQNKFNYRTLFVVGRGKTAKSEIDIAEEARQHNDIVQADFVDAYRNLTIKYISWMRYVRDHCPQVKLIVKLDDDVVGNIFWMFDDINQGKISTNRTITCSKIMQELDAIRDKSSPWYVSKEAHPSERWEDACVGAALCQSSDLCKELIKQAETHQHYISLDDRFFTGMIAKEIGANHNFELYGKNFVDYEEPKTEAHLLDKTHLFGLYTTSASARRIFNELKYLYGEETDPIDDFPKSIKIGPSDDEE